jgi:hypothetical protein
LIHAVQHRFTLRTSPAFPDAWKYFCDGDADAVAQVQLFRHSAIGRVKLSKFPRLAGLGTDWHPQWRVLAPIAGAQVYARPTLYFF